MSAVISEVAADATIIAALQEGIAARDETIRQLQELLRPSKVLPKRLGLTRKEHDVLMALIAHPGQVMAPERVVTAVYGLQDAPGEKIVDVFVCKTRKKLKPFGFEIETRWGFGYSISPEHAAALLAMPEDGGN